MEEDVAIPEYILQDYGCRNCVWKQHRKCPKGLIKSTEVLEGGYCEDIAMFLLGMRATSNSLSQMKEKYFLYSQELQSVADRTKFHELEEKYEDMKLDPIANQEELEELRMAINQTKLWWDKLTTNVVKGLQKVGDRESRREEQNIRIEHVSIQQFGQMMMDSEKLLLGENEKEV